MIPSKILPCLASALVLTTSLLSSSQPLYAEGDATSLTSVSFDNTPIRMTRSGFDTSQKYAIQSADGEPIRLTIDVPKQNGTGEVVVTLSQEDGTTLHERSFSEDKNELELEVPSPGIYFLNVESSGIRWGIEIPTGTAASLCLEDGKPVRHVGGLLIQYFYVPKGTTEIQLNAATGHSKYKLDFKNGNGEEMANFSETEPIAPIAVPTGSDGQVWQVNAIWFAPTLFSFENLPNYISTSPNGLLLPKEIVEKDNLR